MGGVVRELVMRKRVSLVIPGVPFLDNLIILLEDSQSEKVFVFGGVRLAILLNIGQILGIRDRILSLDITVS